MTNIQPITVPTKGTGTAFEMSVVSYGLGSSSASFYWFVQDDTGQKLLDGNLTMTSPEIDAWGTDDAYVIDWALAVLNFVKI